MSNDLLVDLVNQLEKLDATYKKQRADLEKQMDEIRKKKQVDAIAEIRALMEENHITAAQLTIGKKEKRPASKKLTTPKFKGPNGETWSGRGRPPAWLGADREKFRMAP